MTDPERDAAQRTRVRPDDTISIAGRIGPHRVALEINGSSLHGLLDEYRRLSTPKQREQLARLAYEIADSMIAARRRSPR